MKQRNAAGEDEIQNEAWIYGKDIRIEAWEK